MITGYRLRVSPFLQPLPVLFISPACPVSDEVRDEMNAWLLERFGRRPAVAVIDNASRTVYLPPSFFGEKHDPQ